MNGYRKFDRVCRFQDINEGSTSLCVQELRRLKGRRVSKTVACKQEVGLVVIAWLLVVESVQDQGQYQSQVS